MRGLRFEELFAQYLDRYYGWKVNAEARNSGYDFVIENNNEKIYFELKFYTNKAVSGQKILRICEQLHTRLCSDGRIVLPILKH